MREARYGGAEGDEAPSATATTNRHYADNATVEDALSVEAAMACGRDWWQADIVAVLRHIIVLCERQIKRHNDTCGRLSSVQLEAYWLPFAEFCRLCMSTCNVDVTVNYMGEFLDDFQHAYGEPAQRTRFIQAILPRATEAAKLKIKL